MLVALSNGADAFAQNRRLAHLSRCAVKVDYCDEDKSDSGVASSVSALGAAERFVVKLFGTRRIEFFRLARSKKQLAYRSLRRSGVSVRVHVKGIPGAEGSSIVGYRMQILSICFWHEVFRPL